MSEQRDNQTLEKNTARVVRKTLVTVVLMFGFGYALVPFYNLVCEAFGLNGQTEQITEADLRKTPVDKSRVITVEFDANVTGLPWKFGPNISSIKVHPGEVRRISYLAINQSDKAIVGQARHSVVPQEAAAHFKKTECFCFTQQLLRAGEKKDMGVVFVIDPALPKTIKTVTLSYTFFKSNDQQAALTNDKITR